MFRIHKGENFGCPIFSCFVFIIIIKGIKKKEKGMKWITKEEALGWKVNG